MRCTSRPSAPLPFDAPPQAGSSVPMELRQTTVRRTVEGPVCPGRRLFQLLCFGSSAVLARAFRKALCSFRGMDKRMTLPT